MSLETIVHHFLSDNKTILESNISNSNNITNNDTSPYTSEENENEGYLYLLIIDLLIFSSLTYTTYNSSKKVEIEEMKIAKTEKEDNSQQFRSYLMKWLVIANALRTLSLIFIIIISNPNGNNGISWINSVLHIVPAFVFVTSYIYLAIFFSEIYYKAINYINHILRPTLTIVINSGYIILFIIAVITLLAKAYKSFFYLSELLMALLYLMLGSVIIYYGKCASDIFRDKNYYENNSYDNNIRMMSFSIGGLFLLKGISGILEGIGAYSPPNHNVFDFFWFLILEILPTVIFIYAAMNLKTKNNLNDTPRTSSINELEIESQRSTSYRPPFEREIN